jgi:hypothetical protein
MCCRLVPTFILVFFSSTLFSRVPREKKNEKKVNQFNHLCAPDPLFSFISGSSFCFCGSVAIECWRKCSQIVEKWVNLQFPFKLVRTTLESGPIFETGMGGGGEESRATIVLVLVSYAMEQGIQFCIYFFKEKNNSDICFTSSHYSHIH